MKRILLLAVLMIGSVAFAQDVPAMPTYLDSVLAWISANLALVAGIVTGLEVVLRLFPSIKPLSFLVPAKYLIDGSVAILGFLSASVLKPLIDNFGQNVKAPALKSLK